MTIFLITMLAYRHKGMRGCDATGFPISVFQGRASNDVIVILRRQARWGSHMEVLGWCEAFLAEGTAQTLDSVVGPGWFQKALAVTSLGPALAGPGNEGVDE